MSPSSSLRQFLLVARLEGVSFLLLLFVAMPLKYLAGQPLAVRIVGAAHGVLFLAFVAVLARVALEDGWRRGRIATAFVASLLPFGTFWLESRLARDGVTGAAARR